ncbi:MAG: Trk system potassium transporter TrkA, partial [Prolixibacteraceae bacterium]|nr:Trk system potassium transporter TrkA [Prolixibacteraceae bacterium]
ACSMASFLGVERTIARINNSEYLKEPYREKLRNMGIHELIYPENLVSKEIVSSVKLTGTRQMVEFSGGRLVLFAIKIRSNAPILNQALEEFSKHTSNIFAVAIKRNNVTIIPAGKDVIQDGDIVYFTTTRMAYKQIFELTGNELHEIKNIMFLGGSRIAQRSIERLGDQYRIKVVESDKQKCEKLADRFENILVINGDGHNLEMLRDEGLDKMDAFIATTGSSELNILACHLAKESGVKRTVAEVENFDFMSLAEEMDIGMVINKKLTAASYIFRFTLNAEISTVKCLNASDAEVFEFIVKPGARITQKQVKDMDFPREAKIGGVVRDNQAFIVDGNTQIKEGDRVVIFTLPEGIKKLEKFFK